MGTRVLVPFPFPINLDWSTRILVRNEFPVQAPEAPQQEGATLVDPFTIPGSNSAIGLQGNYMNTRKFLDCNQPMRIPCSLFATAILLLSAYAVSLADTAQP